MAELWAGVEPEAARRLLAAAVEEFAVHGFHATTTRDIALRAGLSPAGMYVHYPSKAALLGQISRLGHEAALELVRRAIEDGPDPLTRVRLVVERFVAWHAERHRVARIVQYEFSALEPADRAQVTALRRQIERLMEGQVRLGIADDVFDVAQPRQAVRAVLSLGIDVARWYDATKRESPAALGRFYGMLSLRMLGARMEARVNGR